MKLLALGCGLFELGLVVVAHRAIIGFVVSVFGCAETVFQIRKSRSGPLDLGNQFIDPVHHSADGALGDFLDGRKRRIDRSAECIARMIGRDKPCGQCGHQRNNQPDGVCLQNRIESGLCCGKTSGSAFCSSVGGGHRSRGSCLNDGHRRGSGDVAFIAQERRTGSGDNSRHNADGLFQLAHLFVVIEERHDQLICLADDVTVGLEEAVGQLADESADVVLQRGEPTIHGLAGLQHAVVELPAFAGGGLNGCGQLVEADLAVRDALVQVRHAFAGRVADLIQRVETRVDHHVDVFQRDLLGRGHLAVGPDEGLELVRIAQRDIAQLLEHTGGVIRRDAEL